MRGLCVLMLAAAGGLLLAGCHAPATSSLPQAAGLEAPYRVVTTVGMITDLVQRIAGDRADVVGLMGAGVDPHLYKPTANDIRELRGADVVFYSGLTLEGRMEEVLRQIQRRGRHVYAVTDALEPEQLLHASEAAGHPDPHVWMDVELWKKCAAGIAATLSELDPAGADHYRERFESLAAELDELDAYVQRVMQSIPDQQRVLVTAHDAFEYFSRAYGIPVRSAQGISTESEPGVNDINELVAFLVQRKIRAIFVESSVSETNLRAVLEGASSQGWSAQIGGELFSDAMGPAGTYEGTYVGMIDHNATTIARALGGEAPAGGFRSESSAAAAAE